MKNMKKELTDYEKRRLLLEAAQKEFLEKGYNKASLRSICAKAGMTTGALYFFFDGKEDLYHAIVDGPVKGLQEMILKHFMEDRESMKDIQCIEECLVDHKSVSDTFLDFIYEHYDCFQLLLAGSKDGELEKCLDGFVQLAEKNSSTMIELAPGFQLDPFMTHWMSHVTVDAFVHVIKHEKDIRKAKERMGNIMNYLVRGWAELALMPAKK